MQMKNARKITRELENEEAINRCAEEFTMIGDPTRLKICYLLCRHKELSVGEIAEIIGVSISAVSHTLNKLKEQSVVEGRRDFRHVYYAIKQSPLTTMIKGRLAKL